MLVTKKDLESAVQKLSIFNFWGGNSVADTRSSGFIAWESYNPKVSEENPLFSVFGSSVYH